MGEQDLPRSFWLELLQLYDEFIRTGKTDKETIEMLGKAGLLREGTLMGQEIINAFPHLEFKDVEPLVRKGIREKIVENLKRAVDDTI
ncbi:MAG TPA: hypothetical protein GXX21_08870 [Syntrophomonadaceae bacterium]|nr:hypothetical protein [Syntrophomonadaceae bacterium]